MTMREPDWQSDDGSVVLYQGDCLQIMPTLADGSVDAVITDPPYGIGFPYLSYDDTEQNLTHLIDGLWKSWHRLSTRMFVLCGPTQIGMYPKPKWVCNVTWNTTGSFGKYGYNQWTPVLCYGDDIAGFGSVNGMLKSDTMRISGGGGVGFQRSAEEKQHTCPKPITVMDVVVRRLTLGGSRILDPFMGSGTTGVACVRTGRKFIGIELERRYFDISVKRIQDAIAERDSKLTFASTGP